MKALHRSLGYTVLKTLDNRRVVMPNSQVSSQTTINLSSIDARIMAIVPVGIAYTADVARAREILLDIARTHSDVTEVVDCPVTELGNSSVVLSTRAWCHDSQAVRRFEWVLLEAARERFAAAGIEIPYPYQNIVIKGRAGRDVADR